MRVSLQTSVEDEWPSRGAPLGLAGAPRRWSMRLASWLRTNPPIDLGIAEVYLALLSPIDGGAEGGNPAFGEAS